MRFLIQELFFGQIGCDQVISEMRRRKMRRRPFLQEMWISSRKCSSLALQDGIGFFETGPDDIKFYCINELDTVDSV